MDAPGKQVNATLLFARIRDFARIVNILTLNETHEFVTDCAETIMTAAVKYGGSLANVTGDEIRLVFADPNAEDDNPKHAVICALNIQNKIDDISVKWRHALDFLIEIDIGISTGTILVGNVARAARKMYTLIGKHVTLATQLAELCRSYNVSILLDGSTYEKAKDYFTFRKSGDRLLLGFTERIDVYTPLVSAE
ncbi:MAG: adenylate/guanylate cyclase domain-containing protein [candidate division WOR-3 bacterium]|nr:MAG: adenylate/guanylate cyclase domain-containing protein [candidate division WOR-3 bacterium]